MLVAGTGKNGAEELVKMKGRSKERKQGNGQEQAKTPKKNQEWRNAQKRWQKKIQGHITRISCFMHKKLWLTIELQSL